MFQIQGFPTLLLMKDPEVCVCVCVCVVRVCFPFIFPSFWQSWLQYRKNVCFFLFSFFWQSWLQYLAALQVSVLLGVCSVFSLSKFKIPTYLLLKKNLRCLFWCVCVCMCLSYIYTHILYVCIWLYIHVHVNIMYVCVYMYMYMCCIGVRRCNRAAYVRRRQHTCICIV
jgi:hypothetical protein